MPDEFVDDPASLPVERVVNGVSKPISVVKIEQEASIATITFGEDLVINLGEGDEKADDESDFFSIKIPNIGTEDRYTIIVRWARLGQLQEYLDFQ